MSQTKTTTPSYSSTFQVLEVALEAVGAAGPVIDLVRRRDRSLGDQLARAIASVPMNIAEGNGRVGKDRLHHFRIAAGSAREVRVGLRVATALHGPAAGTDDVLGLLDRVLAMLWVLTHPRR